MNITTVRRDGDDYGPLEIEFTRDYVFEYDIEQQRVPIVVSSGTVTIRQGTTLFVDQEPVVIPPEGGFSYEFLGADQPDEPTEAVIAEFFLKGVGDVEATAREIFDIVRVPLRVPIDEQDLFNRYPLLRDARRLGLEEGFADVTSTASTLVAVQLEIYEDGFYTGGEVEVTNGPNVGEWRRAVDFDSATGTVTVSPDFPEALTEESQFRLRRSWQPIIAEAWADIRKKVRDRGNRPSLIMDSQSFRQCLLMVAGGMAFNALSRGAEDDPMQVQAERLGKAGWLAFDSTRFIYDALDGGDPTGTIKQQVVHVTRR